MIYYIVFDQHNHCIQLLDVMYMQYLIIKYSTL